MIYYFLPDPGIFGGVKVGCQFVEMLNSLGVRAVLALPEARAPQWFDARAAVVSDEEALARITENDWAMITWPPDYERLRELPARLMCHCQGTDVKMDPVFADQRFSIMTCWEQAARYVREKFSRDSIDVGISISDCFYFDGGQKHANRVAYMPRRGFRIASSCIQKCRGLDFVPIEGLPEWEVSRLLKKSGIYLATAEGEQFGLPALEAMAAGCVVLSVPVNGGMEYLLDGDNCFVTQPEDMAARLRWIARRENKPLMEKMRCRAMDTAFQYRPALQLRRLKGLLSSELRELIS
jgi:glycosyltransferase involved in cell wall biosynthesis